MISDLIVWNEYKNVYTRSIDGEERMDTIKYTEYIQYYLNNNEDICYEFVFNADWNPPSFLVDSVRYYPYVDWYGWEFIDKPNYFIL